MNGIYEWSHTPTEKEKARMAIMQAVCEEFRISPDELTGKSKQRELVDARGFFAIICANHLNDTRLAIARALHKDHSTIINSIQRIESEIAVKLVYKKQLLRIEEKLFKQQSI